MASSNRKSKVLAAVGVLLVAAGGTVWCARSEWARSHTEMQDFLGRLSEATTRADVKRMVAGYKDLALYAPEAEETWSVSTPLALNARNWVAWIDFVDDKVARVRVRTYDDKSARPEGAPPDRTFGTK